MNLDRLLFYDNIRTDEAVRNAVKLAEKTAGVSAPDTGKVSEEEEAMYYELQREMMRRVVTGDTEGTRWENYIFRLVAESENPFSLSAEKDDVGKDTALLAQGDVEVIRELLKLDWNAVSERIDPGRSCVCAMIPEIREDGHACLVRDALSEELSMAESTWRLEEYYREHYCGILGKYLAFVWNGTLQGVRNHDPITFDDLIGYDVQQRQLIRNTEVFVRGKRANNVLLYGDKGTGKSSSVKALLNYFGDRGLRMTAYRRRGFSISQRSWSWWPTVDAGSSSSSTTSLSSRRKSSISISSRFWKAVSKFSRRMYWSTSHRTGVISSRRPGRTEILQTGRSLPQTAFRNASLWQTASD